MGKLVYSVKSFNSREECTQKLDGCLAPSARTDGSIPMKFVYYDHTFHVVCAHCLEARLHSGDWVLAVK